MRASTSPLEEAGAYLDSRPSGYFVGSHRVRLGLLAGLATFYVLVAGAVLAPSQALAARPYVGQVAGFKHPTAVTVDPEDNLWVADQSGVKPGVALISEWSPAGVLLSTQAGNQTFGECLNETVLSLAVDAVGNLIVDFRSGCGSEGRFESFDRTGTLTALAPGDTGAFFPEWTYATVDSSVDYSRELIYATEPAPTYLSTGSWTSGPRKIRGVNAFDNLGNHHNFSGSAEYVKVFAITGTPKGEFASPPSALAVDGQGDVYAADGGRQAVSEFNSEGLLLREFTGAGVPGGLSSQLTGLAIDPITGNLLVADAGKRDIDEFAPSGGFESQITGTGPAENFESVAGVGVNSTGEVYAAEPVGGVVDIFSPSSSAPVQAKVSNGSATVNSSSSATVTAEVDPEGLPLTDCHVEYGAEGPFDFSAPCEPAAASIPADANNHDVSASLNGLTGHTRYFYRFIATDSSGTTRAAERSFVTKDPEPPTLDQAFAKDVAPTTATVSAEINPHFGATSALVEYGESASYGEVTPASRVTPADGSDHTVEVALSGLRPGTTYHYHVVTLNYGGTTTGGDLQLRTPGPPQIIATPPVEVGQTTAGLTATIASNGAPTTYHFEYGLTPAYGASTPEAGPVEGSSNVSQVASGLAPGVTYHFRVVADNAAGESQGVDQTLTTQTTKAGGGSGQTGSIHCKHGRIRRHGKCVKSRRHHKSHRSGRGG